MREVTPDELGGSSKTAVVIGPFGSNLKTSDFTDRGVPLIFVRDIRAGDFSEPRAFVSAEKARQLRAHVALPGDLVLTKMGDPPGDVAIYDGTGPAVITADCIRLRPTGDYDGRYLLHAFKTPRVRQQVLDITSGAAQKKVSLERFRHRVTVPVPPLPEQRRIAAILDHADALRAKRRQVLTHLDSLTQSIFNEMFGGIAAEATVGDVAQIQGGLQVSAKRANLPVEVPYLRVANVYRGWLDLSEVKTLQATAVEVERTTLMAGDLLFVEGHANPLEVGRVAMWTGTVDNCVHQNHLIRARLDPARALPVFASSWLNTDRGAAHFRRAGKTTSGLNTISASTVRAAPLPLPPIALQSEFAKRVDATRDQRAVARRALAADDELFASLLSRAFRGEL